VWLLAAAACAVGPGTDKGSDAALDTAPLTPCEQAASEPTEYAVGTGEASFEPLDDGDPLPFNRGPQGGWHVFGSFWATGVLPGDPEDFADPSNPQVTFQVLVNGSFLGGYTDLPRPMDPVDGGGWAIVGDTLALDIDAPEDIDGAEAVLEVAFLDGCGTALLDARSVVLYDGDR